MRRAPKTGSIYKRKSDGRFVAAYRDAEGKPRVLYAKTRAEAQDRLSDALAAIEQGMSPLDSQITVGDFLIRWLDSVQSTIKPRTYRSYHDTCHLHIIPVLGQIKLRELRPMAIHHWRDGMTDKGLSPRTVQYHHTILKMALKQAVDWEMVSRNVAKNVRQVRVPRIEIEALDKTQARALTHAVIHDEPNGTLYILAVSMGCRRGEILALRWQDIDFDKKTLSINNTLQRQDGKLVLAEPKSVRSRRTLDMPDMLIRELKKHRKTMMANGMGWKEDDYVFTSHLGTPVDAGNLARDFERVLKKAGLPRVTFHSLRHTAASILIEQGVDPITVMAWLGHTDPTVTLSIYCHLVSSKQRQDAADKIDAVYRQNIPQ